jgi:hypothetical protein
MIFAQALNFWNGANGSPALWMKIGLALVTGIIFIFLLMKVPPQFRRAIIAGFTFLAGLINIAYWLWPEPIAREAGTMPNGPIEGIGFFLDDAVITSGSFYNILAGFLLGLGVYSILRIHVRKFIKQQQDWFFSGVLLFSMLLMIIFGYWDWINHLDPAKASLWDDVNLYPWNNKVYDLLFEGLLQQMDAAMFSIIAFYILSAAYRAFRVRSVEATILLATALVVMLSLMGAVAYVWDQGVLGNAHGILTSFRLKDVSDWLSATLQTPSLRAIDFGVGIGALAMGMRLWLSLERGGVSQ